LPETASEEDGDELDIIIKKAEPLPKDQASKPSLTDDSEQSQDWA